MRHVELTIFENQSILHEKGVTLPVGLKVSFRQLGILTVGVLAAFVGFFITKDFIAPGITIAITLGFGLPNTKIMTPDQKVKSMILFLIRGTSLTKDKPDYIKKKNNVRKTENRSAEKKKITKYNKKQKTRNKKFTIQSIIDCFDMMLNKNASVKPETTPEDKLNTISIIRNKNKLYVNGLDDFDNKLFFENEKESAEFVIVGNNNNKPNIRPKINIKKNDSAPIILNENKGFGFYKTDRRGNLEISFDEDKKYQRYKISVIVDGNKEIAI